MGDRSENAFMRLYERFLDTDKYRSNDYAVYGCLPRNKRKMGKGGAVNRNEGVAHSATREVEQAGS